jgi:hypothetical protein
MLKMVLFACLDLSVRRFEFDRNYAAAWRQVAQSKKGFERKVAKPGNFTGNG